MGILTIVLNDEIEVKLRDAVKKLYGSSKGSLSRVVEDALRSYLSSLELQKTVYIAYRENEKVAESETLEGLASQLKEKGLDVRNLRIVSSERIKSVARAGYRIKKVR